MNEPLILTDEKIIFAVDYLLQSTGVCRTIVKAMLLAIQNNDVAAFESMLSLNYQLDDDDHKEIISKSMSLNNIHLFKKAYFFQNFNKDSDTLNKILDQATSIHNTDILAFLLEQGADGSLKNERVWKNAAMLGNLDFIQFMTLHYHINFKNESGDILLMALRIEQIEIIEYLISHGARLKEYSHEPFKTVSQDIWQYAQHIQEKVIQYEKMNIDIPHTHIISQSKI